MNGVLMSMLMVAIAGYYINERGCDTHALASRFTASEPKVKTETNRNRPQTSASKTNRKRWKRRDGKGLVGEGRKI